MADEDLALIRTLLRAPSVDAFYEYLDEDVEWDVSRSPEAPTVIRGRDEVRLFMQRWRHGWEHWRFEEDDFLDAGDRVVTIAAPAGVDPRPAAAWTVRGGKVVSFVWYERESEARADAGLD
jgi:ketosteroid isomerase-like protein